MKDVITVTEDPVSGWVLKPLEVRVSQALSKEEMAGPPDWWIKRVAEASRAARERIRLYDARARARSAHRPSQRVAEARLHRMGPTTRHTRIGILDGRVKLAGRG
jgi:hypothetical protein